MNTEHTFTQPEANQPQQPERHELGRKASELRPGRRDAPARRATGSAAAGVAVVLSSFLPWVSIEGVDDHAPVRAVAW